MRPKKSKALEQAAQTEAETPKTGISRINICVSCNRYLKDDPHYHTVVSKSVGADSICCLCAIKQGYKCDDSIVDIEDMLDAAIEDFEEYLKAKERKPLSRGARDLLNMLKDNDEVMLSPDAWNDAEELQQSGLIDILITKTERGYTVAVKKT